MLPLTQCRTQHDGGRRQPRPELQEPDRRVPPRRAGVLRPRGGAGAGGQRAHRACAPGATPGAARRPLPGPRRAAAGRMGRRPPRGGRVRIGGGVGLAPVLAAPAGPLLPGPRRDVQHRPRGAGDDLPTRRGAGAGVAGPRHRAAPLPGLRLRGLQACRDVRGALAGQRQPGGAPQSAEHGHRGARPGRRLRQRRARPSRPGRGPRQAGQGAPWRARPGLHRHLR